MSEICQKLAFTHPIVVLKRGLKNNWMKKLDRVNRPLDTQKKILTILSFVFGNNEEHVTASLIRLP